MPAEWIYSVDQFFGAGSEVLPSSPAPPHSTADITVGRQLFVDDALIESTDLRREFHRPKCYRQVLYPDTPMEMNHSHCPVAAPFNDGIWYDPKDGLFKLWYHAGWFDGTAIAVSKDGYEWNRSELDIIPGTNAVVLPKPGFQRDGGLVWLDHAAPANERYKMFQYYRWKDGAGGEVSVSSDGIHWKVVENTSQCGDNTSFFYNPFRQKYVFSIRQSYRSKGGSVRCRYYYEGNSFVEAATWAKDRPIPWYRADHDDTADPLIGDAVQLYDLNAVAYESMLIGAFGMFYGPQNPVCAATGVPKRVDLQLGYSRDGFHWHRPDRTSFIPGTGSDGDWNRGYIHAAGGLFCVVRDELRFFFGAFSGVSPMLKSGETRAFEQDNSMYAGGSTGMAVLRRDGFASMNGPGELLTVPLIHKGNHLFVNCRGILRAEILDESGSVIPPFGKENCSVLMADATCQELRWRGVADLSSLLERTIRIRFLLRLGQLYAFWLTTDVRGASYGYVGAGGPGFEGSRDTVGQMK